MPIAILTLFYDKRDQSCHILTAKITVEIADEITEITK
jgi:hypothetical protein